MNKKELKKGEIIIYQTKTGSIEFRGDFKHETIWATQSQIVNLFGVDQSVVSRHIKNLFKDGEINEKSNMQKMHNANSDKPVTSYSLDVILGVGYRTNSKVAIEFRKWATKTLKDYLVKGYAVNEKRLLETRSKFEELKTAVEFLKNKAGHELASGQEKEILNLLADYSKTLTLLEQYDAEKVVLSKQGKGKFVLDYSAAQKVITEIKKELIEKKEASELFGQETGEKKINDNGLAALALLIAISDPKEKDKLIKIVTNLLK